MPQKLHEISCFKNFDPIGCSSFFSVKKNPGAAGYLGRELCAQLLEDNYRVTALVRKAGRCPADSAELKEGGY